MAQWQVTVTGLLGELEHVCSSIGRVRAELDDQSAGTAPPPSALSVSLEEASQAAFRALVALRDSCRELQDVA